MRSVLTRHPLAVLAALPFLTLTLPAAAPAQDFTGRVVEDSSGEAIASAELKIHKTGMRELIADLDTDRSGHFTGTDLPAGDYTIDVLKPNFITVTFPIHLPNAGLQIRLLHFGVLDGHVTNISGAPVAGMVRAPYGQTIGATRLTVLVKQPGSEEFRSVRDTSLDDAGHFRFYDLPPGQYELGMWFYGIAEGSGMQLYPDNVNPRVFAIAGGEIYKDLNFLIAPNPAYKVSGMVQLPAPGTKYALALGLPDQPILPLSVALTKDDGSFQFDKVPAGTYDLFAAGPTGGYGQYESVLDRKSEALFGRMRIQVAGSDVTNLAVSVSPARTLSFVLKSHGGAPFPAECPQSATFSITSIEPWSVRFETSAPVSAGKEQKVTGLPPGRFRLVPSGLGSGCYQAAETLVDLSREVAEPVVVEVAAAGSIQGVLKSENAPATSFAVLLLDSTNTSGGASQLALPDAAGHFTFEELRPGRYRIAAVPATEASKSRWIANFSQMKEIDIAGGNATNVELTVPTLVPGLQRGEQ